MKSLSGHFLVASPYLRDPNFAQTVVLMLQHESQGALGVVVNRPGNKTVDEVWSLIGSEPCECGDPIFVGGPVPGPLIALHDQAELAEKEVMPRLFLSMQRDAVDRLVRTPEARFRLFTGHAGWGAGQLDGEMEAGGWLTIAADADQVFGDPDGLWKSVCGAIGRAIVARDIPKKQMPRDPELN